MEEKISANTYELTVLLSPDLSEFDVQKIVDKVKTSITAKGGNIQKEYGWGKKRLAYHIGKAEFGHYHTLIFEAPKEAIAEIDKGLRLMPEMLRHLIISLIKEGVTIDQLFTPEKEAAQVIMNMKEKTESAPHQTRATRRRAGMVAEVEAPEMKDIRVTDLPPNDEMEELIEPAIETEEETIKRREELDKKLDELLKEE